MDMLDPLHIGLLGLCFLATAAFFAGLIDSVAGGGGLISLPATLLAGVPPQLALGTGMNQRLPQPKQGFRQDWQVWRVSNDGDAQTLHAIGVRQDRNRRATVRNGPVSRQEREAAIRS